MTTGRRAPRLPTMTASGAHGLLTGADLAAHGMNRHAIDHAVRRGELVRLAVGLFAIPGSPDTVERRALAATIVLRGALAAECGIAWWGVSGFDVEPLHVMRFRPGSSDRSELAILHRPVRLLTDHLTVWRGVPVARPARSLFDIAAYMHPGRVERAYDTLWSRGLVTQPSMERMLKDLQGRGRPGIQLMRRLIVARREFDQPTGSRLERRFEELNKRAGIPMLRRQIDVGDDEGWLGRMDFVGEERRLIAEIDSEMHHSALVDTRRDVSQTERLEAAGWHVYRIDENDLWYGSVRVARELRERWFAAPAK